LDKKSAPHGKKAVTTGDIGRILTDDLISSHAIFSRKMTSNFKP